MNYDEFKQYKILEDKNNPFSILYEMETGDRFYIEPAFMTQMHGFKEQFSNRYDEIVDRLLFLVSKNHRVVFTSNYDCPQTNADDYIYLEVTDITDGLQIFAEDKSRGSDYGD